MEEEYSERNSYGERYSGRGDYGDSSSYSGRGYSQRGGYSNRDWDDMEERRYRDYAGKYR